MRLYPTPGNQIARSRRGEMQGSHARQLRRMEIKGGLQHCIGKEVSRFEQGKDDFIENIDDECIHYDGGRVAANESLIAEIRARGLRRTTRETGLDRKTIRSILNRRKVKAATLGKVVVGLQNEKSRFSAPRPGCSHIKKNGNYLQHFIERSASPSWCAGRYQPRRSL